jgi:anti-sigma regulatory factor (Ser/Thr protein kinase)
VTVKAGADKRMQTQTLHSGEPGGDVRFCLVFPRESLSIPVMRRVLGDTLRRLGVDDACVADLLLAVTEACTNVLLHARRGNGYEVVARVGRHSCLLEVLDSGIGLGPAAVLAWGAGVLHRRLGSAGRMAQPRLITRPPARLSAAPPRLVRGPRAAGPGTRGERLGRSPRQARQRSRRSMARLPESGRGLAIMRACVDDVTLRSRPGRGTVVYLQKRIELRRDAPLAREPVCQLRDAG